MQDRLRKHIKFLLRNFWLSYIPQLVNVLALLLPFFEEYQRTLVLMSVALLVTLLPINIVIVLLQERRRDRYLLGIHKAIYLAMKSLHEITDEHHHITSYCVHYNITGSDAACEARLLGVNAHPQGLVSHRFPMLSVDDAASDLIQVAVRDNISGRTVDPETRPVAPGAVVSVASFAPRRIGEPIDLSIKKFYPGAMTRRTEYVFVMLTGLERGCDFLQLTIAADRDVRSFWATQVRDGQIVPCEKADYIPKTIENGRAECGFSVRHPSPDVYILNFIF
jgi:hypothetical protein